MGLLEELQQRMNPTNYYSPVAPEEETYTDYSSGFPIRMKRSKWDRAPDPAGSPLERVAPPVTAPVPLPAMAQQAGLLAPGAGGLGNLPGEGADLGPLAPPSPPAPPPAAAPDLPPPVTVGATPTDGPAATDISARARTTAPSSPVDLVPPTPPASAPASSAEAAPSMFGRLGGGLMDGLERNSNALLALGAGFAGAPNIGQAISRASAAMIPAHAADVKQRLAVQAQTYGTKALVDAGVPIQQAIAAQGDPDLKKALIQNYIVDRKAELKEIGVDRYGNKQYGVFDPFAKKIEPIKTGLESPDAQVTAENDVTGPDYLAKLKESDPAYARQVEQVINGDAAMPTGRQSQTPIGRRLRQDVLTVEPGASDSDFNTRQATQKSYTSGNDAKVTKSINTTLHHAETLERAINDLDNFNTLPAVLNPVRSAVKGQYDPKYQKASGQYETAVANFAKELDFAVSGGRPTVSGTKHQMEGFDLNAPKEKQLAKLQEGVDLLKGRLESHTEGYNKGRRTTRAAIDFIDPINRKFYQRVLGEGGATVDGAPAMPVPAPAAAATAPKPGRYVYDPATGKMVPQ